MMTLAEKYLSNLNTVRVSTSLLYSLEDVVDKTQGSINRLDRLRIATALFHDLRISDYGLVKFLFTQELRSLSRSKPKLNELYTVNLIGLLLSRYKDPEDVWLFFKTHQRDKRFDIEFSLTSGVEFLFKYLTTRSHPLKSEVHRKIGNSYQSRKYNQETIDQWKDEQESFFEEFCSLHQDEIHFAYMMEEFQYVKQLLPRWLEKQRGWTSESLVRYIAYARAVNEPDYEVSSLELYLTHQREQAPVSYILDLAELYSSTGQPDKAVEKYSAALRVASEKKTVDAALKGLCKTILTLSTTDPKNDLVKNVYCIIQEHRRTMKDISASTSTSIDKVTRLMATTEDPRS